jgi:hypothetical protein
MRPAHVNAWVGPPDCVPPDWVEVVQAAGDPVRGWQALRRYLDSQYPFALL